MFFLVALATTSVATFTNKAFLERGGTISTFFVMFISITGVLLPIEGDITYFLAAFVGMMVVIGLREFLDHRSRSKLQQKIR